MKVYYGKRIHYGIGVAKFKNTNDYGMWFTVDNCITNGSNWKKINAVQFYFYSCYYWFMATFLRTKLEKIRNKAFHKY